MKHTTSCCITLALVLAMFLILACGDGAPQADPPEYCSLDPKPLICP